METKDTRNVNLNRKRCEYCGHIYSKSLPICPECGRRNARQKRLQDPEQIVLKIIKWIGIGALIYAGLIISVTAIKWIFIGPTEEDGLWKWLYDILSGAKPMTAIGGFAVLWTLFIVMLIWAVPIGIVVAVLKAKKYRNDQDKAVYDKAYQLQKDKLEQEKEQYAPQKIITCRYCGGHARFGQGTCPHCGAALTKPE